MSRTVENWFEEFENKEEILSIGRKLDAFFCEISEILPDTKRNRLTEYKLDFDKEYRMKKREGFNKTIRIVEKSTEKERFKKGLFLLYFYTVYMIIVENLENIGRDLKVSDMETENEIFIRQMILLNEILENKKYRLATDSYSKIELRKQTEKLQNKILENMDRNYRKCSEIFYLIEYTVEENFENFDEELMKIKKKYKKI